MITPFDHFILPPASYLKKDIQGDATKNMYRKVENSNTSCFEAHADLFRLSMKEIFDPYDL
jgi:hypothetical protein